MKVITSSLLFLLLFGCSDSVAFEPVEPDVIRVEINPRLDIDENGYYKVGFSGYNYVQVFAQSEGIQRIFWASSDSFTVVPEFFLDISEQV